MTDTTPSSSRRHQGRKTAAAVVAAVLPAAFAVLLPAAPASAQIAFPYLAVHPSSPVIGQPFEVQMERPFDAYPGCPTAFTWQILDSENNVVAQDTLAPSTPRPGGGVNAVPSTVTISDEHAPGIYRIEGAPGQRCEGSAVGGPDFEVTAPKVAGPVISISPASQTHRIDEDTAAVTATIMQPVPDDADGNASSVPPAPVSDALVNFAITGVNSTATGTCQPSNCRTDTSGQVTFTYAGQNVGHDTVNVRQAARTGYGSNASAGTDWTHSRRGYRFAALGDSYSAGEGTHVYDDGTDTDGVNKCHRSQLAYGPRLAAPNPATLGDIAHVACSGAVTDDLFDPNHSGNLVVPGTTRSDGTRDLDTRRTEDPQLCDSSAVIASCTDGDLPAVGPRTKTVTLTIGGNDAGFAPILTQCVFAGNSVVTGSAPGLGRGCALRSKVFTPAYQRIAALNGLGSVNAPNNGPRIHSYSAVLAAIHKAAPNAHVYLAGYPRLFQPNSLKDCDVGTLNLTNGTAVDLKVAASDALWLDGLANLLNTSMSTAVQRAGNWATFVNPVSRFQGHGLCGKDSWLTPINAKVGPSASPPVTASQEAAHPDVTGQLSGYRPAFISAGAMT